MAADADEGGAPNIEEELTELIGAGKKVGDELANLQVPLLLSSTRGYSASGFPLGCSNSSLNTAHREPHHGGSFSALPGVPAVAGTWATRGANHKPPTNPHGKTNSMVFRSEIHLRDGSSSTRRQGESDVNTIQLVSR